MTAIGLRWVKHDEMQQNMYDHIHISYSPIIQVFIFEASRYMYDESNKSNYSTSFYTFSRMDVTFVDASSVSDPSTGLGSPVETKNEHN